MPLLGGGSGGLPDGSGRGSSGVEGQEEQEEPAKRRKKQPHSVAESPCLGCKGKRGWCCRRGQPGHLPVLGAAA
eukprot:SAG25_NODE_1170_length_3706_cov_3.752703_1_plen_74_part_00